MNCDGLAAYIENKLTREESDFDVFSRDNALSISYLYKVGPVFKRKDKRGRMSCDEAGIRNEAKAIL